MPTNAELKVERALEVFNASEHTRTVGGIARSLGAPAVSARPLPDRPSVVGIAVMWELSWYRFEIDLSDEAGGVRQIAQGAELSELDADEQVVERRGGRAGRTAPCRRRMKLNGWSSDREIATGRIALVIFCVVPEPLAPELYDQLAAYYEDDPNVTVIIDRRKSERRDRADGTAGGKREIRDRRRARVAGEFPPIAADVEA